ncbi:MAG: type II toxin-antitoxin system RelE/ParE family toxin [Candidatus Paceibacterota bacterium]
MNKLIVDGRCGKFTKSLVEPTKSRVSRYINLLENNGVFLSMPYAKKISGSLYELRIRGRLEIRLIYAFYGQTIWVLHGFIKKTNKTPDKEIRTAQKRFLELTKT